MVRTKRLVLGAVGASAVLVALLFVLGAVGASPLGSPVHTASMSGADSNVGSGSNSTGNGTGNSTGHSCPGMAGTGSTTANPLTGAVSVRE